MPDYRNFFTDDQINRLMKQLYGNENTSDITGDDILNHFFLYLMGEKGMDLKQMESINSLDGAKTQKLVDSYMRDMKEHSVELPLKPNKKQIAAVRDNQE